MKKPIWILLVGGLAIYFGLWGIIGNILSIAGTLSMDMEIQSEGIGQGEDSERSNRAASEQSDPPLGEGPWWAIGISVMALCVSGIYLAGGIILITSPNRVQVFYYAMATSILWAIGKALFFAQGQLQLILILLPGFAPSMVIDLILAGIVFIGTRSQIPQEPVGSGQAHRPEAFAGQSFFFKRDILTISGWVAVLCLALLPFWLMGLPGSDNNYARGWNIGLQTLMAFPIAWLVVYGLFRLLKLTLPPTHHPSLNTGVSIFLGLFLGLALLRIGQALALVFS